MTELPITIQVLTESLLQDLLSNLIREQTLQCISRHRALQETCGNPTEKIKYETNPLRDIYGQDKMKLKTLEGSRYFQCDNCGRKIAGGRFAQHVNKCLERRRG